MLCDDLVERDGGREGSFKRERIYIYIVYLYYIIYINYIFINYK